MAKVADKSRQRRINRGMRDRIEREPADALRFSKKPEIQKSRNLKIQKSESPPLTPEDRELVRQLERQFGLIRARTQTAVYGHGTAVYLTGRPGTGKTYMVTAELAKHDVPWFLHNARLTPMGLYELLRQHPEHVMVLDDIPSIAKDKQAIQILLAALDGQPGQPRTVRYRSKDKNESFDYSGRLILISNVPLGSDPMAQAIGSRVQSLEHDPSDDVMAAYLRFLASRGNDGLTPLECRLVADMVVEQTRASGLRLDLRHYNKAMADFRQCRAGHADETPWEVLVRSSLQQSVRDYFHAPLSKAEDIARQQEIVRAVCEEFPNDAQRQQEAFAARTGLGRSTFAARKRETRNLRLAS